MIWIGYDEMLERVGEATYGEKEKHSYQRHGTWRADSQRYCYRQYGLSSALSGKDAKTGVLSPDPDEQAEAMFRNLRLFMEQAGGTPDNIAHMTVFLKEEKLRESVNKAWLKMFPDEHDRPARHAIKAELRGDNLFQIEVIAVL
jgi:2-iminobutanoate/2-iminopropanoate deaminase